MVDPKLAAVIGNPISHTKSPLIHNYWIKKYQLKSQYFPIHIEEDKIDKLLPASDIIGLQGFNVTIPFKEAIIPQLHELGPAATRSGSVNTVWRAPDGGWVGDSTDGVGFWRNLVSAGFDSVAGKTVCFLGAGGAARAVLDHLAVEGAAELRIANRTRARAEALAEALAAHHGPIAQCWDWPPSPAFFDGADLIVNGTSLGMQGHPPFDLAIPPLAAHVVATDLVYTPLDTPFLQAASDAGAKGVDGLGMLLHQAVPGFERWFGVRPEVTDALRQLVLSGSGYLP